MTVKTQKHTAGPWELNGLSIESAREGKWIACTDSRMANDLAEDQANARLIAAAPAMLEALQIIADLIYTRGDDLGEHTSIAEAAIRSAKGETP